VGELTPFLTMPRPRKVHEGNSVLIECVIRVPGCANRSTNIEISNFNGSIKESERSAETVEKQMIAGMKTIYGRYVRVNNDFSGSG